jgi:protein required for attachment to host cells
MGQGGWWSRGEKAGLAFVIRGEAIMSPIRIHNGAYVLVCDGSQALLFRNKGEALALDLEVVEVAFEPHPPTRELGAERPGRVHESLGASRSGVRSPDWHDIAETEFLRAVVHKLETVVRDRDIRELVLVAPPRAMGVLRGILPASVRTILAAEVEKDLARRPTAAIEGHLAALAQLP